MSEKGQGSSLTIAATVRLVHPSTVGIIVLPDKLVEWCSTSMNYHQMHTPLFFFDAKIMCHLIDGVTGYVYTLIAA